MYLDNPHVETGFLCQLFTDVPSGLGGGSKGRFECLQLLGLDGGAGSPSLGSQVLVIILIAAHLLVGRISTLRVLGIILAGILGIWGQAGVAAGGGCNDEDKKKAMGSLQ